MKKYLISIISIFISFVCMFFYYDPYSESLFFLSSVAALFFKIGVTTGLAVFIISFFEKLEETL